MSTTPPFQPAPRSKSEPPPQPSPPVTGSSALAIELQQIADLLKDCPQEITVNGETTTFTTRDKVHNLRNAADMSGALLADALGKLERCKRLLRDLIAASVLTDGFMTMAVAQTLLQQAEAAKKLLADLEQP